MKYLVAWLNQDLSAILSDKQFNELFPDSRIETVGNTSYLFNPTAGIDIVLKDNLSISAIHLFSGRDGQTSRFKSKKLSELDFEMNRSEIYDLLGKPQESGGSRVSRFGYIPNWDKYYYPAHTIHFQYTLEEQVDLITLESNPKIR